MSINTAPVIEVADLSIDMLACRISVGEHHGIHLSAREMAVLCLLAANPGRVIGRDEILEVIWPEDDVQSNVIDRHIASLRRALHDVADRPRYIETVPGRGYRFIAWSE